jgi:hypothetical protein
MPRYNIRQVGCLKEKIKILTILTTITSSSRTVTSSVTATIIISLTLFYTLVEISITLLEITRTNTPRLEKSLEITPTSQEATPIATPNRRARIF